MKNGYGCTGALVTLCLLIATPRAAQAGVLVYESDDVTMELGLRIQPRVSVARGPSAAGDEMEWQREFLVRRSRMKIGGTAMSATYYLEWRLDGTGRNAGGVLGAPPVSGVENGYIQFPVRGPALQIRAGLYDQPFSRDRLTSDSKQMTVDRGLVSSVPAGLGLADNVIGVDARGAFDGGRATYVVGVYDNRMIASSLQNTMPMVVARLDVNFGSTRNVYRDAHFGDDSWYSAGVNGSFQGKLEDSAGNEDGRNAAVGVDGMIDVPAGGGRLLVRAEANMIRIEAPAEDGLVTLTMMAGAGFLIGERVQPTVRYDQVKVDDSAGGGNRNATTVGCNYYIRGHNLKVQGDITIRSDSGDGVDGGRLQAQLDF
ncbi:OprO/OprP family phosphate-selective porin [bacterium]|nr:OprO/OprP family phosphate-selective porin [bacterium]